MNFQFYLEKAEGSEEFKKFKKENSDAYLCAGFFVLCYSEDEKGKDVHNLDYYLPKQNKMATFDLDNMQLKISEIEKLKKASEGKEDRDKENEEAGKNKDKKEKPEEIKSEDVKVDLEAIKGIAEDEMKNRTVTDKLNKIIAIVQKQDGKIIWNLNCLAVGFGIIRVHVADEDSSILKFEKLNLMDFMKRV